MYLVVIILYLTNNLSTSYDYPLLYICICNYIVNNKACNYNNNKTFICISGKNCKSCS